MQADSSNELSENTIVKELKLLLSSKNNDQILRAVRYIEHTLNSNLTDRQFFSITCDVFLQADLSHFLCESLATMSFEIIKSVLECWMFFSEEETFFTQYHAVSALEATTRCTLFILCKRYQRKELRLAMQIINKILQNMCTHRCPLEIDSINVEQLIQLMVRVFEINRETGYVSITCCDIFISLLHMQIWNSSTITKLYILFDDSLNILENLWDEPDELRNFDYFDRMCNLCSMALRQCAFVCNQDMDQVDDTEDIEIRSESVSTFKRVFDVSYGVLCNTCAPTYLSPICDVLPISYFTPFANFINCAFTLGRSKEPYKVDLAYTLAINGLLPRLKVMLYLGVHNAQFVEDCILCSANVLTYLSAEELDAENWPNGLIGFRSDLEEGLRELPDDTNYWYEVFSNYTMTELATTSLLVYTYFQIRATNDYPLQYLLPHLAQFMCSLPEPRRLNKLMIKSLWLVFAYSFLSVSLEEHTSEISTANNWLLSALIDSNVADLYTNDIALVLWGFSTRLTPSGLLMELMTLSFSFNDEPHPRLKLLIQGHPQARRVLIDMIRTKSPDIASMSCNLLLEVKDDRGRLSESSQIVWNYLPDLLNDPETPSMNLLALLNLSAFWPARGIPISSLLRCVQCICVYYETCFDPEVTRKIISNPDFRSASMRTVCNALNECQNHADPRVLKHLMQSPLLLTAIDLNTLSLDEEVAITSWELLTSISDLQKTPGDSELPLHPSRLMRTWSKANDAPRIATVSLHLVTSILKSECPAPIISLRWGKDRCSAVRHAQDIAFSLQLLCTSGFDEAWECLSALYNHSAHSSILLEPVARFHPTQSLIRTQLQGGVRALVPMFMNFLNAWFSSLEQLDKETDFIQRRAQDASRFFSNCHFSQLFDETLKILAQVLVHDQTSYLDVKMRRMVADVEKYILQHEDVLSEDLVQKLRRHCSIIHLGV